jgi:hypothetical protein
MAGRAALAPRVSPDRRQMVGPWGLEPQTSTVSKLMRLLNQLICLPVRMGKSFGIVFDFRLAVT